MIMIEVRTRRRCIVRVEATVNINAAASEIDGIRCSRCRCTSVKLLIIR